MVVVDADHPDIETYIDWKVMEEQKVAALVTGSKINQKHLKAVLKACVNCEGSGDDCFQPEKNPALKREIKFARRHLRQWMRPQKRSVNISFQPARGENGVAVEVAEVEPQRREVVLLGQVDGTTTAYTQKPIVLHTANARIETSRRYSSFFRKSSSNRMTSSASVPANGAAVAASNLSSATITFAPTTGLRSSSRTTQTCNLPS